MGLHFVRPLMALDFIYSHGIEITGIRENLITIHFRFFFIKFNYVAFFFFFFFYEMKVYFWLNNYMTKF